MSAAHAKNAMPDLSDSDLFLSELQRLKSSNLALAGISFLAWVQNNPPKHCLLYRAVKRVFARLERDSDSRFWCPGQCCLAPLALSPRHGRDDSNMHV